MREQAMNDAWRMSLGLRSKYPDNQFAYKMFPDVPRLTEDEAHQRIDASLQQAASLNKREWLTRNEYPPGSAGWLTFQAKSLLAGIEHEAVWDEGHVTDYADHHKGEGRSLFVDSEQDDHFVVRQREEARIHRWMGSIMIATTYSAFACEVVLKSIALICKNRAIKTHDLNELFIDIPDASRERILADQPGVEDLFRHKKDAFGKWRYLEPDKTQGGLKTLIDAEPARELGRAARVLLDEAEIAGIRVGFSFRATRNIREGEGFKRVDDKLDFKIHGAEKPPPI